MFNNKIKFISTKEVLEDKETNPIPIKLNIPKWFKELDSKTDTIKNCMPFLDTLTTGYALKLPADLSINHNFIENNKYFRACDFTLIGRSGFYLDCIEFKKKFIFYDNGSLPNFLKSSKISINHTKQLIYKLKLFKNNDIYYSLKNKYNDDINQKYKINNFLMKLCTV